MMECEAAWHRSRMVPTEMLRRLWSVHSVAANDLLGSVDSLHQYQANTTTYAGHTFRHKSAGAFGPDLAKKLSQLVKMEKNVMRSMELVSRERMEVAVSGCHSPVQGTKLTRRSNNSPSGAKRATMTYPMLPTNWVS